MAEYLQDVEIPKNSKVLVNKYRDKTKLAGLNAREHKGIKGNYIVGDDRALILSGPVRENEMGIWTIEKDIVAKLNKEFQDMWKDGEKVEQEETKK